MTTTIVSLVAAQVATHLERDVAEVSKRTGLELVRIVDHDRAAWEARRNVGIVADYGWSADGFEMPLPIDGRFDWHLSSVVLAERLTAVLESDQGAQLDEQCRIAGDSRREGNVVGAYLEAVLHLAYKIVASWADHPDGTPMRVRYASAFVDVATDAPDLAQILTWIDTHFPSTIHKV